jgi:hypothetical protein
MNSEGELSKRGARVFVDVREYDEDQVLRFEAAFVGIFVEAAAGENGGPILRFRRVDSGELVDVRGVVTDLWPAIPGDSYTFRDSGITVSNVDYIAEWTYLESAPGHSDIGVVEM